MESFAEGDRVLRLKCRHIFHTGCIHTATLHNDMNHVGQTCPNCRAAYEPLAIWRFICERPEASQGQPNELHPEVDVVNIATPRDDDLDMDDTPPAYPTFPSTAQDAAEWGGNGLTTSIPQVRTDEREIKSCAYISQTELPDGRQSLLIDPGSWGNLAGSEWAKRTAKLAVGQGLAVTQTKRDRPLNVSGVGKFSQECTHDCQLPITLTTSDGAPIVGTFKTPTVNDSKLPALLGLQALIAQGAILDCRKMQLHFTGPGDNKIELCPGSETFDLVQAPSGHLMLPCCNYDKRPAAPKRDKEPSSITLLARSPTIESADTELSAGASSSTSEADRPTTEA